MNLLQHLGNPQKGEWKMKKLFTLFVAFLIISFCLSAMGRSKGYRKVVGKHRFLAKSYSLTKKVEEKAVDWVNGNLDSDRFKSPPSHNERMVRVHLIDYGESTTFEQARKRLKEDHYKPIGLNKLLSLINECPEEIHPYVAERNSHLETKPIVALGYEWEYPIEDCDDPALILKCDQNTFVPIIYKDVDNRFDIDWMCWDGESSESTPFIFAAIPRWL